MKNLLLIMMFIILTSFSINTNRTYELSGTVKDKYTEECLVGVKVNINGDIVYTDLDGNFNVKLDKPLSIIESDYISYDTFTVVENNNNHINIFME